MQDNSRIRHCNNFVEEIKDLTDFSQKIQKTNPQYSLQLSKRAYKLALKEDFKQGESISLLRMGRCNWILGNFETAISNLLESLEISKNLNLVNYQVDAINILGNIYCTQQNYNKALEYYLEALKLSQSNDYKLMEAGVLNNIGEIHRELKDYHTALDYYMKSKEIYESINEEAPLSTALLNIGHAYFLLNKYDIAKHYLDLSLHICKKNNDNIGLCETFQQIGNFYFKFDNTHKALNYLSKALCISQSLGDKINEIKILIDLYKLTLSLNKNEDALNYIKRAFKLAEETKSNALISKTSSYLAKLYEKNKSYRKALCFYKKYYETEKAIHESEVEQKLISITTQFKIEKSNQEKEIYRLKNTDLKEKTEKLEKAYQNIKIISDIGQSITSTLDLEKIFTRVYYNINMLMDANALAIGIYNHHNKRIEYKLCIENGERKPVITTSIHSETSLGVWCINNKKEIIINSTEEKHNFRIKNPIPTGDEMESIIYCPLMIENTVLGVITVQSKIKNAYTSLDLDTIKALASYISIAVKNAEESNKLAEEIAIRKSAQIELIKLNEKLLKLSEIDTLTGIANRRHFEAYFKLQWEKCKIRSLPMSLLIIDIDYFKEYNDKYGHLAGDEIIAKVAKVLNSCVASPHNFLARYGGDEFIAILPNTNGEDALNIAEKMRSSVEKLDIVHKYSKAGDYLTITIGAASLIPSSKQSPRNLFEYADKTLYLAKMAGRNRVNLFEN